MKVVLFCGGKGLRIRDFAEQMPKPMVRIGYRPILWHLMKYYAHFGHREFILCLGHQADVIKNYFLHYDEAISNDFVLTRGGQRVDLLASDISDWQITFVDTGREANIGQRLSAVREYLGQDDYFFANYADGLTDLPLNALVDHTRATNSVASMALVNPTQSFHVVRTRPDGSAENLCGAADCGLWVNGGFFVFRKDIFDYIRPDEDLVNEPFRRLMDAGLLQTYTHRGFWACMDTFKEKMLFDDMYDRGNPPWEVWKRALEPVRPSDEAVKPLGDRMPSVLKTSSLTRTAG